MGRGVSRRCEEALSVMLRCRKEALWPLWAVVEDILVMMMVLYTTRFSGQNYVFDDLNSRWTRPHESTTM